MTTQALRRDCAQAPRRPRLADNVIALHAEDRPSIIQPIRRGRYPRNVVRINSVPRLYVGCFCELRGVGTSAVLVRVTKIDSENDIYIESAKGEYIIYNGGGSGKAAVTNARNLHRTVFGDRHV